MGRDLWIMEEIRLHSWAKINLGLEVLDLRPDGYHNLITLFQTINLRDHLVFKLRSDSRIILSGDRQDVPWDEKNLIFQAAHALQTLSRKKVGVEIRVEKNIPPGRGLAGGSSNAAVTILALNHLWALGLNTKRLQALGATLGADIPFFFYGGLCLGKGKGDKLKMLPDLIKRWVLLVIPDFPVSTAMVYRELDRRQAVLTSRGKASKIIQFLKDKDISLIRYFRNDLELAALQIYPQLAEIKQKIAASGAELSMMSGSGSAVFGLFEDQLRAQLTAENLRTDYQVFLVETVSGERYRQELSTGA